MTSPERTTVSSFRRHVRTGVLAELRLGGPATRAELMQRLGLSRTALTRVLAGLFDEALIEEEESATEPRSAGRPARRLRARRPPRRTLAVRVESEHVTVSIVDEDGRVHASVRERVPLAAGLPGVVDVVRAARRAFAAEPPIDRLVAALPTMVALDGRAVNPDGARALMRSWLPGGSVRMLERAAELPALLQNDGRLAALAEARIGAAGGVRNVLYIAPGANGIAGGLVLDGRLHVGAGSAGEISHVVARIGGIECPCGRRGCLAAEVRGVARRLRASARLPEGDRDELGVPVEHEGYPAAVAEIATMLARVIGGSINLLHPEAVVISDRLTSGPAAGLFPLVAASIGLYAHPALSPSVTVRASTLGEAAVVAGAGLVDAVGPHHG